MELECIPKEVEKKTVAATWDFYQLFVLIRNNWIYTCDESEHKTMCCNSEQGDVTFMKHDVISSN